MSDPSLWTRNETSKSVFNPLTDDFIIEFRNDKNEIEIYTVPSMNMVTHPTYLADFLIKHLVDRIIEKRDLGYVSPEARAEIQKEIEV